MEQSHRSCADFLNQEHPCACGRIHRTALQCVEMGAGAIAKLPARLKERGYQSVLMIDDRHTDAAAGAQVERALKEAGLRVKKHCFAQADVVPDEQAVGEIMVALPADCDVIVGVGTGTLNDLSKFCSFKLRLPYWIVGTAPSMDGFASTGAALIIENLKTTYETHAAEGIIADSDVLQKAPMEMITAGLADVLGKYTCLCDWEMARIINGEYSCPWIIGMVREAIQTCVDCAPALAARKPEAVQAVMDALMLTGIAMSFAGNSRPASGAEHHLSHYWEMKFLQQGRKPVLHGTKVGIGTVAVLKLYEYLRKETVDFAAARAHAEAYDAQQWQALMRRTFGVAADGVIAVEAAAKKNDPAGVLARLEVIEAKWDELRAAMQALLVPAEQLERLLLSLGAPINPMQVGVDRAMIVDSVLVAKEVRNRYTVLQLCWDLGILEPMAQRIADYFACGQQTYKDAMLARKREQLAQVQCFVLDMDGTIYLGDQLFDFTKDFLQTARAAGKDVVFLTNNSSRNAQMYVEKLARMGIAVEKEKMLISNAVILEHLQRHHAGQRVYVVGTPALVEDFRAAGVPLSDTDPQVVVLGFDTTLDYEKLAKACHFVRNGARLYGVNMDYNCPTEHGFIPDCGSIAKLVLASTGVQAEFFGKPSRHMLDYVKEHTGYAENELAFVGDRLYTDIAIADGTQALSILVWTGEAKPADLFQSQTQPKMICDSLAEIAALLRGNGR